MQFDDTQLQKDLKMLRVREEEQLIKRSADEQDMPYINLEGMSISTDALATIKEEDSKKAEIAGFNLVGQNLSLAVHSITNPNLNELVQKLNDDGYETTLYLASENSLQRAWDRYEDLKLTSGSHGSFIDISEESLKNIVDQVKTNKDVRELFDTVADEEENKRTSRLMEIIMGAAIATGSSDIHIEPQDEQVRLRYRQDGILEDVADFDYKTYKQLMSRIKILSSMKLNVVKNAQDGRFTIDFNNVEIEIRVSTAPSAYGEGVVMRVLNPSGINVGLEQLGIEPFLLDILKAEVEKPNGLILNTGPTGSGKTTTLYSLLKYIHNDEIKILTIEDPIEYHLEGIEQTPIDHAVGYDFEAGMRAAMRHDPDVILVGEIRDHETALAAMQASQTGHLVLSTLHTNNASGAVPRLLDLDINHSTLAQSMTMALAQRLVRKLTDAKKKVQPTKEQERIMRAVLKNAQRNGKDLSRFNLSHDMAEMFIYEPVPNERSESGYKGRVGIFEAILIDDAVKDILEEKPSDRRVKKVAQGQGILTLTEDAVVKVLQGVTSYEEVMRVVDLTEDVAEELGMVGTVVSEDDADKNVITQGQEIITNEKHNTPQQNPVSRNVGQEVEFLVDYLKMLEDHQSNYPEQGVAEKIQNVQDMIIELLKNNHPHDVFLQKNNEYRVQHEIDLLIQDLSNLRKQQEQTPGQSVAQQLKDIRMSIESLKH